MHKLLIPTLLASALVLMASGPARAVTPEQARRVAPHVPGQVLVRFRADARLVEIDAELVRLGAVPVRGLGRGRAQRLDLAPGDDVSRAAARLMASGLVEYAEPNYLRRPLVACNVLVAPHFCPNDLASNQYALHDITANDADMDLPEAWALTANANGVLLAIADDGFDLGHSDLAANLRAGVSCDGDGSCSGTAQAQQSDERHGTLVAGSAAAVGGNGLLIASPLLSGDVLPIRMPSFTSEAIADAVDHAIAAGARIINFSIGGPAFSQTEFDAFQRARDAGMIVFAAAGNEDSNTDAATSAYPANYDLANLIAVAASNSLDDLADFSSWGSMTVDLAAAGDGVVTTNRGGGTTGVRGTSFASPYAAGVAALIGQNLIDGGSTTWDYRDLKARLFAGADVTSDAGALALRGRVAAGRVNARGALNAPVGGVLVVRGVAYDDSTIIDAANNANGLPDPGETFDIVVTLGNAWQASGTVGGVLSVETAGADLSITDGIDTFADPGAVGASEATTTARFRATVAANATGHAHLRLQLALTPQVGAVQTRFFQIELGTLHNGDEIQQPFQLTDWDEFHAWHATVPVGSTNVVFETHTNNGIDIDLLARRDVRPEYLITLDVNPESNAAMFWAGEETSNKAIISGRIDGEELIGDPSNSSTDISGTQSGTWHLVTINFDRLLHTYRLKASWDAAGAGTIRFAGATTSATESSGMARISVVRSGGVGPVSVAYATSDGTALAGTDYTASSGTLAWGNGDISTKTISVLLTADGVKESSEGFTVTLSAPVGGADLGRYRSNAVTIKKPKSSGGGGGSPDPAALLLLALLAAARRGVTRTLLGSA